MRRSERELAGLVATQVSSAVASAEPVVKTVLADASLLTVTGGPGVGSLNLRLQKQYPPKVRDGKTDLPGLQAMKFPSGVTAQQRR